ncbi:MAG: bifunctional ornithine acetyltransferase/N-acetylglutamate synthase [Lachnospiraceae bacterium]|nr:bifunctional ornithine acetyltransferase/N-acetylglutamate synthase [Lachnospiraceae bacterium]
MSVPRKLDNGGITVPEGFTAGAVYVGVKSHKSYKPDVAVLLSDRPAACAALFTTNRFCAAPVTLGRKLAAKGRIRGIVINSGNANAGTGEAGMKAAQAVQAYAEELFGLEPDSLLVSSTGVIGEAFPTEKVKRAVELIRPKMSREEGSQAAWAIMTTDRHRKEAAYELPLSGGTVRVGVMAKGSGMIHPNMATTLCFITTDAAMDPADMKIMLKNACDESFHALTVDGDTSTNDSLIMLANGASGVAAASPEDREAMQLLLEEILTDIARQIAADGEGAQKTLTVRVKGLPDKEEARRMARGICRSNGVKVAFGYGTLPETLILTAAGGEAADSSLDFSLVESRIEWDDEDAFVHLDFHSGPGEAVAYGCDLTGEYVHLNGDYRT